LLASQWHLADLIQEQRASGRFLETGRVGHLGVREGAASVAEQLALSRFGGRQRSSRHERPAAALAVQRTRDQSLPVPVSPKISTRRRSWHARMSSFTLRTTLLSPTSGKALAPPRVLAQSADLSLQLLGTHGAGHAQPSSLGLRAW
jgi:hypothetical protein